MPWLVTSGVDVTVTLHAENGDSVQIFPRSRDVQVADIFGWNPPKSVRMRKIGNDVTDPTVITPGVAHDEANVKPAKSEPTKFDTQEIVPPKTVDFPESALKPAAPKV